MDKIEYIDLLRENKVLKQKLKSPFYSITVLSNIVTFQLNEILEYHLRVRGINAQVESGDYDNIIQDSQRYQNANAVIVFFEAANITAELYFRITLMKDLEIGEILDATKAKIDLILANLRQSPLVIFNKFSSKVFNSGRIKEDNFELLCSNLNDYLLQSCPSNTYLVELDNILLRTGIDSSVDFRYFYSSSSLYTIEFYQEYAKYIQPIICSAQGKVKKALIFDCDNTLWSGVLGEDGINGIQMSPHSSKGKLFAEIQCMALGLNLKGVLLGLCSKNNLKDVNEVLKEHPDMMIREENISIKRINWNDKATNLISIAEELNIGLDSLVFIDDSDFEVNLVREQLPEVTVVQVPKRLYQYPQVFRDCLPLFFNISESQEDKQKVQMYREQQQRAREKSRFLNLEDYLGSLKLKIKIQFEKQELVARTSQMTQKTNQFNLTTKRYSESEITEFILRPSHRVIAFEVTDKFGESGVVGLCIYYYLDNKKVEIDTFLMSCRIIGRNLEFAFFDFLIEYLKQEQVEEINSKYYKTPKNDQVANFYDELGFDLIKKNENEKYYKINLDKYVFKNIKYIEVEDEFRN